MGPNDENKAIDLIGNQLSHELASIVFHLDLLEGFVTKFYIMYLQTFSTEKVTEMGMDFSRKVVSAF